MVSKCCLQNGTGFSQALSQGWQQMTNAYGACKPCCMPKQGQ